MQDIATLSQYADELKTTGSVLIPANVLFDDDEIASFLRWLEDIPEERIRDGDAGDEHDVFVKRLMLDGVGEVPRRVNQPFAGQILDVWSDERRDRMFSELFASSNAYCIRRCQQNRLVEGSFVGIHLDSDSNPDYEFAAMLQLRRGFDGGEFVVYPDGGNTQIFLPPFGAVLITSCKYRHEVAVVRKDERAALVCFFSKNHGMNRRQIP